MVRDPKNPSDKTATSTLVSFLAFEATDGAPKNPLEKFLSLFADVRSGEGLGVVLMTVNTFLLLGAYYLLKIARETLILTEGGAEVKTYSSAGQALVLILLVPVYGWIGTKVNRVRLVAGLTLFFDDLGTTDAERASSSLSSGRLPTTSTPRRKAAAFSRSSALAAAWAR